MRWSKRLRNLQIICLWRMSAGGVQLRQAAMHDVSQGGILAALWEMAQRLGAGLEVDLKQIAVRQETVEISEAVGANPYSMPSSGALSHRSGERIRSLQRAGTAFRSKPP